MTKQITGKFRLWRKQVNGEWQSRAGVYDFSNSNDVQMAARHVMKGIGYKAYEASKQRVGDKTPYIEFDWDSVDVTELNKKTDSICYMEKLIGDKMSNFAKKYKAISRNGRNGKHSYTEAEKQEIDKKALINAVKRYKEGKSIPYFMKEEVLDYLSNEKL